jgi:hypothetical protein
LASRLCCAVIVKHRQADVPEREHRRRRAWLPGQDQTSVLTCGPVVAAQISLTLP